MSKKVPTTTSTPTTRILAIGTINPGVDQAKVLEILPNEVRETVNLYLDWGHPPPPATGRTRRRRREQSLRIDRAPDCRSDPNPRRWESPRMGSRCCDWDRKSVQEVSEPAD
jgi:hypothetical protein